MRFKTLRPVKTVFICSVLFFGCLPSADFKVSLRVTDETTGKPIPNALVIIGAYETVEPKIEEPGYMPFGAARGMTDSKGTIVLKRLEGEYFRETSKSAKPETKSKITGVMGGSILVFAPGYGAIHQPFGIQDNPGFQQELKNQGLKSEDYTGWFGPGPKDWNYDCLLFNGKELLEGKTIVIKVKKPADAGHAFASFQPEVLWEADIATSWKTGASKEEKSKIFDFFKEQMEYAVTVSTDPYYQQWLESFEKPEHRKKFILHKANLPIQQEQPAPVVSGFVQSEKAQALTAADQPQEVEEHNHDTTMHIWMTKEAIKLLPEGYKEVKDYASAILEGVKAEDDDARFYNHFYNPYAPEVGYKGHDTTLKWGAIGYPDNSGNTWDWEDAQRYYRAGDKQKAYRALGHVLHLLEDMTCPMHTHMIRHVTHWDEAAHFESYFAKGLQEHNNNLPMEYSLTDPDIKTVSLHEQFEKTARLTTGSFTQNGQTVNFDNYYASGKLIKQPGDETLDLMGQYLFPKTISAAKQLLAGYYNTMHPELTAQAKTSATDAASSGAGLALGQKDTGREIPKQMGEESTGTIDVEEYTPKEIIQGQWGTRPGEFGHILVQAPGEVPEEQAPPKIIVGPDCMFVDKEDNIYILDQINKRLQKFSSTGIFLTAIPLAFPEDVILNDIATFTETYVDMAGFIYMSYNIGPFSWFVFDTTGKLVKRLVDKKSIEYEVRILDKVPSQKQRKAMLDGIMSNTKTILVDAPIASARYNNNGEIYIGNMRLGMGAIRKTTSAEMKSENALTASQKAENFISRAKKTIYEPKNKKPIRLTDIATGEQSVSSKGEVYKIIRSTNTDDIPGLRIIKWQKAK